MRERERWPRNWGSLDPVRNALTIDVEEWFQVETFADRLPPSRWHEHASRVEAPTRMLLELLASAGVRATFFVLGCVAERHPDLVRDIATGGHEIASHGWSHTPLWRLSPGELDDELRRTRGQLQELSGQPVLGFRAPTFSVRADTLWALNRIAAAGHRYDSSIFPVRHDRYGMPDAPLDVHWRSEGLWEIPLTVLPLGSLRIPVAGGGYFRLYPGWVTRAAIRQVNRTGRPAIVYLHPWEFDPGQPRLPGVGTASALRHRVGIPRNREKLESALREFRFGTAWEVLQDVGVEAAGSVATMLEEGLA